MTVRKATRKSMDPLPPSPHMRDDSPSFFSHSTCRVSRPPRPLPRPTPVAEATADHIFDDTLVTDICTAPFRAPSSAARELRGRPRPRYSTARPGRSRRERTAHGAGSVMARRQASFGGAGSDGIAPSFVTGRCGSSFVPQKDPQPRRPSIRSAAPLEALAGHHGRLCLGGLQQRQVERPGTPSPPFLPSRDSWEPVKMLRFEVSDLFIPRAPNTF